MFTVLVFRIINVKEFLEHASCLLRCSNPQKSGAFDEFIPRYKKLSATVVYQDF